MQITRWTMVDGKTEDESLEIFPPGARHLGRVTFLMFGIFNILLESGIVHDR
jgi:hypothetical protein